MHLHQESYNLEFDSQNENQLVIVNIAKGPQCLQILSVLGKAHSQVATLDFRVDSKICLVQMDSKDSTDTAFSQLQLDGHQIMRSSTITKSQWRKFNSKSSPVLPKGTVDPEYFHRTHFYLLHPHPHPLDEELKTFIRLAVMSPKDIQDRLRMLSVLQGILNFGKIHPFGSFLTGLSDPHSDVDVYFEDFKGEVKKELLIKVHLALKSLNSPFKILQVIPKARVPIITFLHVETNVKCDISFKNILSVQNSRLILFLTLLDPIVHPLLVLVKAWAHFHHLVTRSGLKSYALVLLVLFFLVRKKILPSIHSIQSYTSTPPLIVGGLWNANFCDDLGKIRKLMEMTGCQRSNYDVQRPSLILPYLVEFFEMVENELDEKVMVCTVLGQILPRKLFHVEQRDKLPGSIRPFFDTDAKKNKFQTRRKSLCIQDPFDLHYDVGSCCDNAHHLKLVEAAKDTRQRLEDGMPNNKLLDLFQPIQMPGRTARKTKRLSLLLESHGVH